MTAKRLNIKPLSVNRAWRGRRFKTDTYKAYEREVIYTLPTNIIIPDDKIEIYLKFGFSSSLSDFDNPVKPFVDCLQKKYRFDDKMIKRAVIDVDDVKRGQDYIEFEIKKLDKK